MPAILPTTSAEESIEGQIRECTAFAEKNDIAVLKHYIDRAYSARTDHRPAFQEMIKDSDKASVRYGHRLEARPFFP